MNYNKAITVSSNDSQVFKIIHQDLFANSTLYHDDQITCMTDEICHKMNDIGIDGLEYVGWLRYEKDYSTSIAIEYNNPKVVDKIIQVFSDCIDVYADMVKDDAVLNKEDTQLFNIHLHKLLLDYELPLKDDINNKRNKI